MGVTVSTDLVIDGLKDIYMSRFKSMLPNQSCTKIRIVDSPVWANAAHRNQNCVCPGHKPMFLLHGTGSA